MENLEVRNAEGQLVLPQSQYNPVDPVPGAVYVKDEEYGKVQEAKGQEIVEPAEQPQGGPDAVQPVIAEPAGPASAPVADYESILVEKTGGKYKSLDEVLTALESKPQAPELDQHSKRLYEAIVSGKEKEVLDILYRKQVLSGAKDLSDADVIKLKMQLEHEAEGWTPEDVDDEYELRYGLKVNKDDIDPDEYAKIERRQQRAIAAQAKEARAFIEQQAANFNLPAFEESASGDLDPQLEQALKEMDTWGQDFSKAPENIKSLSKIDLSLNDKDVQFSHEFEITEDEKADLARKVSDYWTTMRSRYTKDGRFDTLALAQDIYFLENRNRILKSAITRAINLGKVAVVKGVANVQDSNNPSPTAPAADAALAAVSDFILR